MPAIAIIELDAYGRLYVHKNWKKLWYWDFLNPHFFSNPNIWILDPLQVWDPLPLPDVQSNCARTNKKYIGNKAKLCWSRPPPTTLRLPYNFLSQSIFWRSWPTNFKSAPSLPIIWANQSTKYSYTKLNFYFIFFSISNFNYC